MQRAVEQPPQSQGKSGKWTLKEDLALMEAVKVHGMKWAVISKELGESRTDHTIKNRANAILKRYNPKKIYKTP